MLAKQPYALVTHPSIPAKSVREVIAYVKASPGKIDYGSPGVASGGHIAGEMFKQMTGIEMTHITYKGSGPATSDLLGGHISFVFSTIPGIQGPVKAGKLRAIAVTTAKRSGALPDTPTVAESGVPGYEANSWNTMVVPRGTPAHIITRLNAELSVALRAPEIRARLVPQGFDPEPSTPQELADYVAGEVARYGKLLKSMGLHDM
jgi:tripartite-type tricarboxylate transporter receptor subunit TctC